MKGASDVNDAIAHVRGLARDLRLRAGHLDEQARRLADALPPGAVIRGTGDMRERLDAESRRVRLSADAVREAARALDRHADSCEAEVAAIGRARAGVLAALDRACDPSEAAALAARLRIDPQAGPADPAWLDAARRLASV